MTAGGLVCEAVGSVAPGATTETFAVAVADETDAPLAEETVDIVYGTLPRVREVWRSELLVWTEDDYRNRHLLGAPFPASGTCL